MDLNELKKLSPAEAIKRAADYVGVSPSVIDSIWNTESGRGANKLSRAGARGDFQIMPATQALLEKKLGAKFDADNFHDSLRMAAEHLKDDMAREGNIVDALRAYNAGPDRKRWNNPETQAYAGKVLGNAVPEYRPEIAGIVARDNVDVMERKSVAPTSKGGYGPAMPKTAAALAAGSFLGSLMADTPTPDTYQQAVSAGIKADIANEKERSERSLLDDARAMFMHQGIVGGVLSRHAREVYQDTPGFQVPEEMLAGLSADQQAHVLSAGSMKEAQRNRWEMDNENEDMRKASLNGPLHTFAASFLAGFPEGAVSGIGVAKAMAVAGYGSYAAAQAGNAGRAIALNFAENVGGNLLTTAAEDAISGRMSVLDYGMSGLLGGVFSGVSVPGTLAQAGKAMAERFKAEAVEAQVRMAQQAAKNLGPGATTEELAAEINRIEAASLRRTIDSNTGQLGSDRQLLSQNVNDELNAANMGEAPSVTAAADKATADATGTSESVANTPNTGSTVLDGADLISNKAREAHVIGQTPLYDHLSDEKTVWKWPDGVTGTTAGFLARKGFSADTVRGMEKGVVVSADSPVPAPFVKTVEWLQKHFAQDTVFLLRDTRDQSWNGMATGIGPRTVMIELDTTKTRSHATLIHEVGHAVLFTQFSKLSEKLQTGFKDFHADWLKQYVGTDKNAAALGRGSVVSAYTENTVWQHTTTEFAASMFDVMSNVLSQVGKLQKTTLGQLKYAGDYIPDINELGAENFVKFVEAAIAKELKWKPTSMPMPLVTFFENMWKMVKSIFNYAKENKLIAPDTRVVDMFEEIRKLNKAAATKERRVAAGLDPYRDAADKINAPLDAFAKWFGKSAAVNADGSPRVYYHGTKAQWDEYNMAYTGEWGGTKEALFVSPSKQFSEKFGANILELYVRAEKTWDYENEQHVQTLIDSGVKLSENDIADLRTGSWPVIERPEVMAWVKSRGFDSFHVFEGGAKNLGLFSPNQIKSIKNQGEWSRDVNNIYKEQPQQPAFAQQAASPSDIAHRYGIDIMPEGTRMQKAEKAAMLELYTRASDPAAPWNNIDAATVARLTDNNLVNVASSGLLLLKSDNPVARMVAAELLESTTGAGGRRSTAALAKYLEERKLMGNVVNELQDTYRAWAQSRNLGMWDRNMNSEHWAKFNTEVAEHIESIRMQRAGSTDPFVQRAALHTQEAFERLRTTQVNSKTLGHLMLPETSVGYMPHRMSPAKLRNITPEQTRAVWSSLVDQFITVDGWDASFSANLASKYLDRIRVRADGGYAAPMGAHDVSAADVVRDALKAMGMDEDEIAANMARYSKGGPSHTKKRLNLDLLREYENADGTTFRLLDLYDTDMLGLVRQQVQRVSGEVALARHGIMGRPGLKVLRTALGFGEAGGKVQPREVQAFDQVAAEFLGDPVGESNKWIDRTLQLNSLARLGGMGITQFAEYINMATTLGLSHAAASIGSMGRLRAEIKALARGERVDNPLLTSLEVYSGAEFGTDAYKMVFPFDNPQMQYQVNGHDTLTVGDRLLRGGSHAQAKLAFWRSIHSVQQRGVAEQIVRKSLRYIRDGGNDVVMRDMGFSPSLVERIRAQMDSAVEWSGNEVAGFDVRKLDRETANEFIEAVHRGSSQIIQGTFIGETGKWAHDGWMRLLSQFRTFSITSVEKQWGRNLSNRGLVTAVGILMGSMAIAAPLHMARVYAASVGRPDQEEYLEKRLAWDQVARATLNYVGSSGLAGDFIDAFSAVTGVGKPEGGRGGGTEFVGNVVMPASGLVDDLWRGVQNTRDGTDPHQLVSSLPFSKLPYLIPIINTLRPD